MSDPFATATATPRPVYIPRRKRPRVPDRTVYEVGAEDGWRPAPAAVREPLAAQDLMDERDFEEWGGATRLRREFQDEDKKGVAASRGAAAAVADLFTVHLPTRVGDRLLARLGWRPATGTTLVSAEEPNNTFGPNDRMAQLLSKRRLRRIQLQQQRVRIPAPKLDTAGLGFDPHRDAPEFRAHRERLLRRRAEEGARRRAYHVDAVLVGRGSSSGGPGAAGAPHDDDGDAAAAYPNLSAEDFVGTTTAAGFALHDDDDAYVFDDQAEVGGRNGGKVRVNADDYEAYAYESAGSDSDDGHNSHRTITNSKPSTTTANVSVFGDVLSSWAGAARPSSPGTGTTTAVTADGERPLPGFVLGGGADHTLQAPRFRGPDLPPGYEVTPHAFGPHESPLVLQALAHAAKLEAADQQMNRALEEARIVALPTVVAAATPSTARLIASAIPGLSKIMSDRFTTGGSSDTPPTEDVDKSESNVIRITRSVQTFYPEPLLCKRFNVPALPKQNPAGATTGPQSREERFFRDHVLSKVDPGPSSAGVIKPSTTRKIERRNDIDELVPDPLLAVQRPEMEVFRSIFAVDSDDGSDQESDGDHDVSDSHAKPTSPDDEHDGSAAVSSSLVVFSKNASASQYEESRLRKRAADRYESSPERSRESDDDSLQARRRRKKHSKHKKDKKKKKKRSAN